MSEYEIEWWKDWLEADMLDRLKMVEKLPFTHNVKNYITAGFSEEQLAHSAASMLNGFFEDLEDAIRTKHYLEDKK